MSKAEALNEQFTSVFTHTEYISVPFEKPSVNKMDNITISSKGVEKILHGLNTTKAMGPDNLHPKVLKELAPNLACILAHLFQQSIDLGTIPEDWKTANICPLFKKVIDHYQVTIGRFL